MAVPPASIVAYKYKTGKEKYTVDQAFFHCFFYFASKWISLILEFRKKILEFRGKILEFRVKILSL